MINPTYERGSNKRTILDLIILLMATILLLIGTSRCEAAETFTEAVQPIANKIHAKCGKAMLELSERVVGAPELTVVFYFSCVSEAYKETSDKMLELTKEKYKQM